LIAWWKFDELTGAVASDSSGHSNSATLSGFTFDSASATGNVGKALTFTGTEHLVNSTVAQHLHSELSFSLWFKRTDASSSARFLIHVGDFNVAGESRNLLTRITPLRLDMYNNTTGSINGPNFTDNTWHHAVLTINAAKESKIYLNGSLFSTSSLSGLADFASGDLHIGARPTSEKFIGLMDEVMVFDRAITLDEITALFKVGQ
jgi:hypothetical protein